MLEEKKPCSVVKRKEVKISEVKRKMIGGKKKGDKKGHR